MVRASNVNYAGTIIVEGQPWEGRGLIAPSGVELEAMIWLEYVRHN